jgi:glycosyltransferase involved in cell wall biosynthesis
VKRAKVIHLTSVHSPNDTRIFHKECKTLVAQGYQVTLIAPHTQNCTVDGVKIVAVKKHAGRLARMTSTLADVFAQALDQKADIYHFHDPELILVGFLLKLLGKRVIYDVHEDLPRQIAGKDWIPRWLRHITSWTAQVVEWLGGLCFDRVVAATPHIAARFPCRKTMVVQNFPILSEFGLNTRYDVERRNPLAVYTGGISVMRGIREMVQAIALLPESLNARNRRL